MRDRVVELIRVRASELKKNPANWRNHDDRQREKMTALLGAVGFVSGVIGVRREDGIRLIDGHMRSDIADDEVIPVQIVDLTEDEERLALATYDPIGDEAPDPNAKALADLLSRVRTESDPIEDLLDSLAKTAREVAIVSEDEVETVVLDQAVQLRPEREYIVVMCDEDGGAQWEALRAALGLKLVRRGGYKVGSAFDDSGIERVIPAGRLLAILGNAEC